MGEFKIITWNMRGETYQGDPMTKVKFLDYLIYGNCCDSGKPVYPVFFLQEAGNLKEIISDPNLHWVKDYTFKFSDPIAALANRCTTGLMIPRWMDNNPQYSSCVLSSGVRSYVKAKVITAGKIIWLSSLHAIASSSAPGDGIDMLENCCQYDYFAAGGDFNCSPDDMCAEDHFTERLREKGYDFDVKYPTKSTHRTESTGVERKLDFICVKGLESSMGEVWCGSMKRGEMYSDHWPVVYTVAY